jgi:hypothetical protein
MDPDDPDKGVVFVSSGPDLGVVVDTEMLTETKSRLGYKNKQSLGPFCGRYHKDIL